MTLSTMLSSMGEGMLRTCAIFFLTILFSMPLGMVIMFLRRSRFFIVREITKLYIAIMRGTPLMLQLLMWYFGPYYLFGMSIRGYRFPAIIIGFSMNYAAYFAEIYRGGIETIPKGQYEAAEVLGYSKAQTFFKIILPQVMKAILPSVTNEIITLVKDTSLAFTLAYNEMFSIAKQIAASQTSFVPFIIAGVFYFIANYAVAFVMERIEKAFDYYK
ncbi:MAG: amino acid ABC transporter permease [Lachnospiraceae bacterium]|jgi:His/Glu/Gln/Arg/opine family amino acid ABC transporter permease subunit|nr:amino acid ABC transporter permease [Lachnospiraceae bacterium]MEE1109148.1 amino acid ABC transporter permease [Lachnospiraceae bacterium]